jgi:hypothetical protein
MISFKMGKPLASFHDFSCITNKPLELIWFSEPGTIFPEMGTKADRHHSLKY